MINFTVFGANALITDDVLQEHPVIAIKSAIVSDFGGHSLSGFDSTGVDINPNIPEAVQLKQWYLTRDASHTTTLSSTMTPIGDPLRRKTLSAIQVNV